jgi:hypothetical protein
MIQHDDDYTFNHCQAVGNGITLCIIKNGYLVTRPDTKNTGKARWHKLPWNYKPTEWREKGGTGKFAFEPGTGMKLPNY